jgi:hypothetical protein
MNDVVCEDVALAREYDRGCFWECFRGFYVIEMRGPRREVGDGNLERCGRKKYGDEFLLIMFSII